MIKLEVYIDHETASAKVAEKLSLQLQAKPTSVLGLATGGTPERTYEMLVTKHSGGAVSFADATTFNLDEYLGLAADHPQSYHAYMRLRLFDPTDCVASRNHLPDGMAADPDAAAIEYDEAIESAGGIDLQLLGLGGNGHIGFNEPGSPGDSHTRVVDLAATTIAANARYFDSPDQVPRQAITMGIGTILRARRIVLLATGAHKADALDRLMNGPVTEDHPASFLQTHQDVTVVADQAAVTT